MDLSRFIEKKLKDTVKECKYKIAYIPKGWAHIHIKTFSKELADLIEEKYARIKN